MTKPVDISGKRFGLLIALEPTERRSGSCVVWKCRCDCGNITYAGVENLRNGNVKSCGCFRREIIRTIAAPSRKAAIEPNYIDGTCVTTLLQNPGIRNTSGVVGVKWHSQKNRWIADIQFKGKRYYLGSSVDKDAMIALRKEAEQRLHGEFLSWYYSMHPEKKKKHQGY